MQSLVFETAAGKIEFCGAPPFILSNLDLGETGKTRSTSRKAGYGHGVVVKGQSVGPRIIRAKCVLLCASEEELFTYRRLLGKYINPGYEGVLYYNNGYQIFKISAGVNSTIVYEDWLRGRRGQYFNIEFYCPDPMFTDLFDISREFLEVTPRFHFPLSIKRGFILSSLAGGDIILINRGDAPCGVRIEVFGPSKNPSVINHTTGEHITINHGVAADQVLEVTTYFSNKRITLYGPGDNVENALHYITYDSTFISLVQGENHIQFRNETGYDLARAKIYFSPGYLVL